MFTDVMLSFLSDLALVRLGFILGKIDWVCMFGVCVLRLVLSVFGVFFC